MIFLLKYLFTVGHSLFLLGTIDNISLDIFYTIKLVSVLSAQKKYIVLNYQRQFLKSSNKVLNLDDTIKCLTLAFDKRTFENLKYHLCWVTLHIKFIFFT